MLNKVLYLNTSSERLQVAVKNGDRLYKFVGKDDAKRHNATLMGVIDDLLNDARLTMEEIQAIAVVTGPGSFTGIRIGVTTALAMRRALGVPVVALTALETVAVDGDCLVYLDCRHDNYYLMERKDSHDNYFNGTGADIKAYKGKKIEVKSDTLKSFIKRADEKIAREEFSEILLPYYQKKSSAEREND